MRDKFKGCRKTVFFVDSADFGFHFAGVSEGGEELVGGEADGFLAIDIAVLTKDHFAREQSEHGVAGPGFFEHLPAAVGSHFQLFSQRRDRVGLHGSQGGDEAGDRGYNCGGDEGDRKCRRIVRVYFDEKVGD